MSEKAPFDKNTLYRLKDYNTSYQDGAWQNFESFRKKKEDRKRFFFFYFKIASVFLLLFLAGWGVNNLFNLNGQISEKHTFIKKPVRAPGHLKLESIQQKPRVTTSPKPVIGVDKKQAVRTAEGKKSLATSKIGQRLLNQAYQKVINPEAITTTALDSSFKQYPGDVFLIPRQFHDLPINIKKPVISIKTEELPYEMPKSLSRVGYSVAINQHVNRMASPSSGYSFGLAGFADVALSPKTDLSFGLGLDRQLLLIQKKKLVYNSSTSGSPRLNRVDYRWLSIEIPLNIRYRMLLAKKWNMHVSGGLSMLGTFGQKFDYRYINNRIITTVTPVESGTPLVSTQILEEESVVRGERSKLVLGSSANFALSFNYKLRGNNLFFEPFVKYPISPITTENLQFFSLGIQLRWALTPSRKVR